MRDEGSSCRRGDAPGRVPDVRSGRWCPRVGTTAARSSRAQHTYRYPQPPFSLTRSGRILHAAGPSASVEARAPFLRLRRDPDSLNLITQVDERWKSATRYSSWRTRPPSGAGTGRVRRVSGQLLQLDDHPLLVRARQIGLEDRPSGPSSMSIRGVSKFWARPPLPRRAPDATRRRGLGLGPSSMTGMVDAPCSWFKAPLRMGLRKARKARRAR